MTLQTKRLSLVPLGPQYLITTHEYARDIENTRYMMHLPNTHISETKDFLDGVQAEWSKMKPKYYEFAVLLNNTHIGAVSILLGKGLCC